MGGVRGTGDEMRDARLPVRVKNGGQGWGGYRCVTVELRRN